MKLICEICGAAFDAIPTAYAHTNKHGWETVTFAVVQEEEM